MKKKLVSSHYLECQATDRVHEVFSHMHNEDIHDVLVYDKKRFVGMLDRHLVHTVRFNKSATIKKFVRKVKKLSLNLSEEDAARLLLDNNLHALPVTDSKKILGIVRAFDLVQSLATAKMLRQPLSTLGTHRPLYFFEDTRIDKALSLLHKHRIDHAPIIDTHLRITGVLSLTDLESYYMVPQENSGGGGRNKLISKTKIKKSTSSGALPLVNFSSSPAITTKPEDTVRSALSLMSKHHISSIVLVDRKDIVGIVTLTDLLRSALLLK